MKNLWLMGGFGNVLFQILAFNVIRNKGYKDIFYVSILTEKNLLTKLIRWRVHQRLYDDLIDKYQIKKVNLLCAVFALFFGFLSKIFKFYSPFSTFYIRDRTLDTENLSTNIFGYFQEKDFLATHMSEIHSLCLFIKEKYTLHVTYDIVVHYRKGDSDWAILYKEYYESVKQLLKKETKQICVVTDSYDDAKKFFSDIENIEIMNSRNAIDDFRIMVSSRKLYCAPSTFSWWAAHTLDENSEIIAPKFLEEDLGMYVMGKYKMI